MNVMNAAGFMQLVANFGFPVVMTFYLLFRFEKRLENIEKTLKNNEEKRRQKE